MFSGLLSSMWPLGGEPHDTSALALLRMQDYSRHGIGTLGSIKEALEAANGYLLHDSGQ